MNILSKYLSTEKSETDNDEDETQKLWKVGDHRVHRETLTGKTNYGTHTSKYTYGGYKCVDCEQTEAHRSSFKRDECYEVLQE